MENAVEATSHSIESRSNPNFPRLVGGRDFWSISQKRILSSVMI